MNITLNGKPHRLGGEQSIAQLVEGLAARPEHVAVARDGEVLPRSTWADVRLREGDVIEVVRAVGGGT